MWEIENGKVDVSIYGPMNQMFLMIFLKNSLIISQILLKKSLEKEMFKFKIKDTNHPQSLNIIQISVLFRKN